MNTGVNTKIDVIRIGVTGHRTLRHYQTLTKSVRSVLQQIECQVRDETHGKPHLVGISPLAEGADRLVAREILKRAGVLEAPLPFPVSEYLSDFNTPASRAEFQELLTRARSVSVMQATISREDAYETVGRFVVDNCDILIALWDGNHSTGRGGTADIVAYAKMTKKPLYWINTDRPGETTLINQRSEKNE